MGGGETEDTRAFGSGSHHAANASGAADPTLPPSQEPTGQGDGEIPLDMARANAVTAFVAPLLLEPNQLKIDHIAPLVALAVERPVNKSAIKLLAPAFSHQEAEAI